MYCSSLSSIDLLPLFLQGMDGIPDVVSSMEYYDLLRSDWDLVCEIARFPKQPDITAQIPSKVCTTIYCRGLPSLYTALVNYKVLVHVHVITVKEIESCCYGNITNTGGEEGAEHLLWHAYSRDN